MRGILIAVILVITAGCADPPLPPTIAESYNGDVGPSPARTESLVTGTHAYWAALAGGRWHQAWRYHTLEFQEAVGFERWLETVRADIYEGRRPKSIRWTRAAHRYQGPELYALMDWVGPGPRKGRITWRETAPGTFRIESSDPF